MSDAKVPGNEQIHRFANVLANTSLAAAEHYVSGRPKEYLLPAAYEFLCYTLVNTRQWLASKFPQTQSDEIMERLVTSAVQLAARAELQVLKLSEGRRMQRERELRALVQDRLQAYGSAARATGIVSSFGRNLAIASGRTDPSEWLAGGFYVRGLLKSADPAKYLTT